MKTKTKTQLWLSPKHAARILDLTPATITRWCRDGKFPHAKKIGRVWRIRGDDIDQL
jgi:excisionase family DNA binding protein